MADIFISYVEEDSPLALEIARVLESQDISTWYYERDSIPGRSYLLHTNEGIDACRSVLLLIPSHSIRSSKVRQQVIHASESKKPSISLLVDMSHGEFQQRQREWRAALGAITSLRIPPEGLQRIVPQLMRSLAALEILPPERDT